MKCFFVAVFLLLGAGRAEAQVDSCLRMAYPNRYFDSLLWATYMNPDSVLVDSCVGSPTYLEYYATKSWGIDFAYYVIKRQPAPYDTTIELPWTAIDTAYGALRSAFAALESKYGSFHLGEIDPNSYDSTAPGSQSYGLRFDHYVCVDSVLADLKSFPDIDSTYGHPSVSFGNYPLWALGPSSGVEGLNPPREGKLSIYPNPSSSGISVVSPDPMMQVTVLDNCGREVRNYELTPPATQVEIDTRGMSAGTYYVRVANSTQGRTVKFTVAR